MATTFLSPNLRSAVRPRVVRPPTTAMVSAGPTMVRIPCEALDTEYPLFGIEYDTIWVPRLSRISELRAWLVIEQRESKDDWQQVWNRCQRQKQSLWHQYVVVSLVKRSRNLPRGPVVFEMTSDFLRLPESELSYLPLRARAAVERCFSTAMRDFPNDRPLQLLKPLFVNQNGQVHLAQPVFVQAVATTRRKEVTQFCARHGTSVRLADSPDHYERTWRQYEAQRFALAREVIKTTGRGNQAAQEALAVVERNVAELLPLADKLGLSTARVRGALYHDVLQMIDPVIVIEEPAWRLPQYDTSLRPLRTIVHWDDSGVTLLNKQ